MSLIELLKESPAYDVLLELGRIAEARRLVLSLGTEKFGHPSEADRAAIESLKDLEVLEGTLRRILIASNWRDLLDAPTER